MSASVAAPVPILFTIPNFITAGSGRAMLNIIERLDRDRFAPAVCVSKKGGDLDRVVDQMGIPFIEAPFACPAKPYRSVLLRANETARTFRPYRFRLWHSFHYADDYTEAIVARLAGARSWIFTKKNMNWNGRAWKVRTELARAVVAQNTDMTENFFVKQRWARKTRLIPRGVDTVMFSPEIAPRLGLRGKLGISAQATVVTCVAHLVPVKNHPTLLEAMSRLPAAHLILAGAAMDKDYSARLDGAIDRLPGRVHRLGNVKDVAALHAESDVFVLPTGGEGEGCPVALLEAMSSGLPCVATDIAGSRDIIEDGDSGYLVPPADADTLAERLRDLSADQELRARMARAARERVVTHYDICIEAAAHQSLYESLTTSRGQR